MPRIDEKDIQIKLSVQNNASFALKRLWSQRWLALCLALGLMTAVALASAIPIYAAGINISLMRSSLAADSDRRAPFDFIFRYIGSWHGEINASEYQPVDEYLSRRAIPELGLPVLGVNRYLATANLQLYPAADQLVSQDRLDLVKLVSLSRVFEQVRLVEGQLPRPPAEADGAVEVLASLDLANELGLQVGERYTLYHPSANAGQDYRQEVILSGLWTPRDPDDLFWTFYTAGSFHNKFLVHEETWWPAVDGLAAPVDEAAWRLALDGSRVNSDEVSRLLARIAAVQNRAGALLAHTDLESSPTPALRRYLQDSMALTGSLFAFSAPLLGLVFFFLWLVAGLFVRRQQVEIAVLRSRGASRGWIITVYLVEWGVLGLAALILGLPAGLGLAGIVGRTRSFLDFSNSPAFTPQLSLSSVVLGGLAMLVAAGFCLLPVWQYGRETIVSYKQEQARAQRRPAWQRAYLDLLCLLPSLYGLFTLRAQGRLSVFGRSLGSADPFGNPLLFLLPALFLLGVSLLALRLLPHGLDACAALAARLPGVTALYLLRRFARSGGDYQGVLLLVAFTVGLATYTASEANTLNRSLYDNLYYATGTDINLVEGGEFITSGAGNLGQSPASGTDGLWNYLPVEEHLAIPGILAAGRVGAYKASLSSAGRSASGQVLGIDWANFGQVAFFREDFSAEPLNALLNRLASSSDALLVDEATWKRLNLNTGDTLELQIESAGQAAKATFQVAGSFTRFPTWNAEENEALFVANLDTLFEAWGGMQPYTVWLKTSPQAGVADIVAGINRLGVTVISVQDARAGVAEALGAPGRQGVQGMLSIGFLATAGLTLLGVLLYTLFSLRQRFVQLGVLRAIGLSAVQTRASLSAELVSLMLAGALIGTAAGSLTVLLFVPYLPLSSGAGVDVLPYVSQVAWPALARVYLLFGAALLAGMAALQVSLRQMSIFQAIKLGETV